MKGIFIIAVTVFALAAAEQGKVAKRGGSSAYATFAAAPAPVVAKAAVAAVAPAPLQYAAAPIAFGGPLGYAAPAIQFANPGYGGALGYATYAAPAYAAPALGYAGAGAVGVASAAKSSGPQGYSQQVPAAAIRNVETVGVTKTITPVVTKTTTYNTHSEPALSVGHVQGYTQSAAGPGKVAPVQYNTQYTQYLNPTVGVNGPVTYSGPAVGQAGFALSAGPGGAVAAAPAAGVGYAGLGYAGQAIGYGGYAAAPIGYAAAAPAYAFAQPQLYAQPAFYAQPAVVTQTQTYAAPSVQIQSGGYGAPAPAAPPAKGGY